VGGGVGRVFKIGAQPVNARTRPEHHNIPETKPTTLFFNKLLEKMELLLGLFLDSLK